MFHHIHNLVRSFLFVTNPKERALRALRFSHPVRRRDPPSYECLFVVPSHVRRPLLLQRAIYCGHAFLLASMTDLSYWYIE